MTHKHLPRLAQTAYGGYASVHWNFTTDRRAEGWLDAAFHAQFRETLLHAALLYRVLCPVYCLMPDHMHLLLMGTHEASDQRRAIAFVRRHVNRLLLSGGGRFELQKQAYDHVLCESERERGAFRAVAWYIAENPVRAKLTQSAHEWPSTGCMVPGHPDWSVFHPEFWTCFWGAYELACRSSIPPLISGGGEGLQQ